MFCFIAMSQPAVLLKAASKITDKLGKTSKEKNKGQLVERKWKSGVSEQSRGVQKLKSRNTRLNCMARKPDASNIAKLGGTRWVFAKHYIPEQMGFQDPFQPSLESYHCDLLTSSPDTVPWRHPWLTMTASVAIKPHHHIGICSPGNGSVRQAPGSELSSLLYA